MSRSIGLQSLAVSVPDRVVTNAHWRRNYPQLVARAEERLWMWKPSDQASDGAEAFNVEMAPYVRDPFRGACERRFLPPGGTSLELEARAAREALERAGLTPEDVDLLICTSFLPDSDGIGGATFLARELGLKGAAWNVESACSSALVALRTACSLVATGQARRALVVTSCTYSRVTEDADPVGWGIGDAATAMVVGPGLPGTGLLGSHNVHSAETCGTVAYEVEPDADGRLAYRLRPGKKTAKLLRDTAEPYLKRCTENALAQAELELDDVDHFVFNTPLAWYAAFCARALGVDPSRTLNVYPFYANVGPALIGLNLLHAAHWKRFRPGDVVLLYSVGSVSSCCAAILRWGDVKLGELPAGTSLEALRGYEAEALARYRLERLDLEVRQPAAAIDEADRRLEQLVAGYVELAIEEPKLMDLFIEDRGRAPAARDDDELGERAERFLDHLEATISDVLEPQARASRVDPKVAALSLLGIVHWGVRSNRAAGRLSRDQAIEQITQLALHGLAAADAPLGG